MRPSNLGKNINKEDKLEFEDSLDLNNETYSSLNDSDSTDEEFTSTLSFNQVKNILKSYTEKLNKWNNSSFNSIKQIKWLVSKKTDFY